MNSETSAYINNSMGKMFTEGNLAVVNLHIIFLVIYLWITYNKCRRDGDYARY